MCAVKNMYNNLARGGAPAGGGRARRRPPGWCRSGPPPRLVI